MQTKLFSLRSAARAFLLFGSMSSASVFGQTLKRITTFDLPGPGGKRFDYLTIDADDHYLISAHLAAAQTYVIDLRTNKVVATVTDTPVQRASNTFRNSRSSTRQTPATTRSVS